MPNWKLATRTCTSTARSVTRRSKDVTQTYADAVRDTTVRDTTTRAAEDAEWQVVKENFQSTALKTALCKSSRHHMTLKPEDVMNRRSECCGTPSAVRRSQTQHTAILQRAEWREVGDRSTRRCERCWSEVRRYSQDRGRRATTDEVLADDEVPQVDGVDGESQRRFAPGFGAPPDPGPGQRPGPPSKEDPRRQEPPRPRSRARGEFQTENSKPSLPGARRNKGLGFLIFSPDGGRVSHVKVFPRAPGARPLKLSKSVFGILGFWRAQH